MGAGANERPRRFKRRRRLRRRARKLAAYQEARLLDRRCGYHRTRAQKRENQTRFRGHCEEEETARVEVEQIFKWQSASIDEEDRGTSAQVAREVTAACG